MGNYNSQEDRNATMSADVRHNVQEQQNRIDAVLGALDSMDRTLETSHFVGRPDCSHDWNTIKEFIYGSIGVYLDLQDQPLTQTSKPSIGTIFNHVTKVKSHAKNAVSIKDDMQSLIHKTSVPKHSSFRTYQASRDVYHGPVDARKHAPVRNQENFRDFPSGSSGLPRMPEEHRGLFLNKDCIGRIINHLSQADDIIRDCESIEKLLISVSRPTHTPAIEPVAPTAAYRMPHHHIPSVVQPIQQACCFLYDNSEQPVNVQLLSIVQERLRQNDINLSTMEWNPGGPAPTPGQPMVAFCYNRSRLGTDVDSLIESTGLKDNLSNVILVIMHHQARHIRKVTPSDQLLFGYTDRLASMVDACFWKDEGCYQCQMNDAAVDKLVTLFMQLDKN